MSKSVLITGVAGFIGSHTAKVFKEAGYKVFGIDWHTHRPESCQYIDQLFIDDFAGVAGFVAAQNNVDAIVHCAGTSLVGPSLFDPYTYYNNNSAKTNIMLQDLVDQSPAWRGTVVFSSSAATYGIPTNPGNIAEYDPKQPISPYGWSKLFCERIIQDHCSANSFKGIALRYFNACGCDPDQTLGHLEDDTHMVPRVLSAYQNKKDFTLYGNDYNTPDGTCIRDYLHVMDIAHAHLEAVRLAETMMPAEFRAYNLGTGQGYSNKEIIDTARRVVDDYINVTVQGRRVGDPDKLVANSSEFQKDTFWKPKYSDIETIVRTTWEWQKNLPLLVDDSI
jgi:UDP-glucose-4-epimerase GalE